MNRFAIRCLFGLFCISLASAKPQYKEFCKIRSGCFDEMYFYIEDAYLYEKIDEERLPEKYYMLKNVRGKHSKDFLIAQHNVAVVENCILVKYLSHGIIMVFEREQDPFKIYQDFGFDLENFPSTNNYPVTKVVRDGKTLENVSVIKAKDTGAGAWILVAFHGNSPRLIFPRSHIDSESVEISGKKVTFSFQPNGDKTEVEFGSPAEATTFYGFVTLPN